MLEVNAARRLFHRGQPDEKVALDGLDLSLASGDFAVVIGSNGAGKSTLLNAISGALTDLGIDDQHQERIRRLEATVERFFHARQRFGSPSTYLPTDDRPIERRYQDLARAEERVDRRSANQDSQASKLELREQVLNKRQSKLDKRQNELADLETIHRQKLEEIAAMTTDEARVVLLQQVEREAQQDMARAMREIDNRAKETAEVQARRIIALAIQRLASDQVAEMVVSTVPLPCST